MIGNNNFINDSTISSLSTYLNKVSLIPNIFHHNLILNSNLILFKFYSSIIGIDLGTTNSCVAIMDKNKPEVIQNIEGKRTTPSIVAYLKDGSILVGLNAKKQMLLNTLNTFYACKRLIGRKYNEKEIQQDIKNLPYKVNKNEKTGEIQLLTERGDIKSPIDIATEVLKKMKNTAEIFLGKKVNKAIITVPAYFNDHQRQATKTAGRLAGLNVLRIINEPTAAALAYGIGINKNQNGVEMNKETKPKRIAVYDLGGGTFDISILELSDGVFEVKATNGNTNLGGEDFDRKLDNYLLNLIKNETKIDILKNKNKYQDALQRIREAGEKAKIELSSNNKSLIYIPYLFIDEKTNKPYHFKYELTRQTFEDLVSDLVQQTLIPCKNCLKDSDYDKSQIDEVILVGGMTKMPYIRKKVGEFFGRIPKTNVNPDEAVAIGAAIQGGILEGQVKDMLLLDVTPLSLGIETMGGIFSKIIDRNSTIPTKKTQIFSTAVDNQDTVIIKVYQGENELTKDNNLLGQFELSGIPKYRRGVPMIEVSFDIDANGIVNVSAIEKTSGKKMSIELKTETKTIEKKKNDIKAKH